MNLYELRDLILDSDPDGWMEVGGSTLLGVDDADENDRTQGVRVIAHTSGAVYHHDISIGLAWGLPSAGRDPRAPSQLGWARFADTTVSTFWADVLYNGVTLDRVDMAEVDGGRAFLPVPSVCCVDESESSPTNACYRVTHWELSLARLLDQIVRRDSEFERYFQFAGFEIVG